MIHIQKDNEGFDIPEKDICSIDIQANTHLNAKGVRKYVNKIFIQIKPSENILCEGEPISQDEFAYRFTEYNDIRFIIIDGEKYIAPWKENKTKYATNVWETSRAIDKNIVEVKIFKPFERKIK